MITKDSEEKKTEGNTKEQVKKSGELEREQSGYVLPVL